MIIKSTVRGNGGKLATYLLNDKKNDRAELVEMRGWTAATLKTALVLSEKIALGKTQCEKPFYHASFRLPAGEELTPEQWQQCADRLEQRLGLEEHHRALVLHTYKGEKHLHVVWDRIDERTLKAINLFQEHRTCMEVARALEKELGLQRVRNRRRDPERELAAPTMAEEQQARRKGQDPKAIRVAIREAWQQSQDGRSFAAALEERGLTLAQGERRDYVAIDAQGGVYSIGKRTTGASACEVRAKLADLDREHIPTVEQARAGLAEREQERQREGQAAELAQELERQEQECAKEKEREQAQARPAPEREPAEPTPRPDRDAGNDAAGRTTAPERTPEPEPEREQPHKRDETRPGAGERSAPHERSGVRVVDRETGLESSVSAFAGKALDYVATQAEGLIEGMASLFDGGSAAPRRPAQEPRPAPQSALLRLQERAARERALRNISQSVQRGDDLNAADLRALSRTHLERLRDGGDEYLQRLVKQFEREREERERERERER